MNGTMPAARPARVSDAQARRSGEGFGRPRRAFARERGWRPGVGIVQAHIRRRSEPGPGNGRQRMQAARTMAAAAAAAVGAALVEGSVGGSGSLRLQFGTRYRPARRVDAIFCSSRRCRILGRGCVHVPRMRGCATARREQKQRTEDDSGKDGPSGHGASYTRSGPRAKRPFAGISPHLARKTRPHLGRGHGLPKRLTPQSATSSPFQSRRVCAGIFRPAFCPRNARNVPLRHRVRPLAERCAVDSV